MYPADETYYAYLNKADNLWTLHRRSDEAVVASGLTQYEALDAVRGLRAYEHICKMEALDTEIDEFDERRTGYVPLAALDPSQESHQDKPDLLQLMQDL